MGNYRLWLCTALGLFGTTAIGAAIIISTALLITAVRLTAFGCAALLVRATICLTTIICVTTVRRAATVATWLFICGSCAASCIVCVVFGVGWLHRSLLIKLAQ